MEEDRPARRYGTVQSVERCIDILLTLTARPMTLSEVSARVELSKSTALRLLGTLGHGGFVVRDPISRNYVLGPGCLRLGQAFVSGMGGFSALAREPIRALWTLTGETVAIHVRLGQQRVCVDELPSAEAVRYVSGVGTSAPIQVGSAGRVLLAFMPEQDLRVLLDHVLASETTGALPDRALFADELEAIRRAGHAMSEGERVRGAAAVSVPIFGPDGLTAALSVLGPSGRFNERKRMDAVEHLTQAASGVQQALQRVAGPAISPAGELTPD